MINILCISPHVSVYLKHCKLAISGFLSGCAWEQNQYCRSYMYVENKVL